MIALKKIFFLLIVISSISCKKNTEIKVLFGNEDFIKENLIISKIDSLKTEKEIEKFVRSIDTTYSKFRLRKYEQFSFLGIQDSLTLEFYKKLKFNHKYQKADLDNNGFTDLLVIGDDNNCYTGNDKTSCSFTPLVIMNFNGSYKLETINLVSFSKIIPKIEYFNNQAFLSVFKITQVEYKVFEEEKVILTYKFGGFIEYNNNPKKYTINKFKFSTNGCFGICPVFDLSICKDSISTFRAIEYNFSDCGFFDIKSKEEQLSRKDEGVFYQFISKKDFNTLIDILNYIEIDALKDHYNVWHTCDQTGILVVKYNNNKIKVIEDYGMVGTYGMKLFYDKLLDFRFDKNWKKQ